MTTNEDLKSLSRAELTKLRARLDAAIAVGGRPREAGGAEGGGGGGRGARVLAG